MEENRAREILEKINQLSLPSADSKIKVNKRVDSKILADALGVPEGKLMDELDELHSHGYIVTMPIDFIKEGKFKHLRVTNIEKAEKFLRGEIEF